ncbi:MULTISPECIES: hypothetical protein [unclassified Pseudoalteromonas]|uniref:hypothetical protein n=2 Tax=Pseudoalteromonas TaxID=53246 RepID=UPI001F2B3002|nr:MULTISPECIES: hypothetical protein [unclassified Pseudoalteromonas]MCF2826595.1 hypothetical protein [Pseudoalteromonas sp. OF5H-5]MCF2926071.1 hypothetical protein [Pseudoalteromonas sp. DL2-H1]
MKEIKIYKAIFFLSILFSTFLSTASNVEIKITKETSKKNFEIEYVFRESVRSITIKNAPENFIMNYWRFKDNHPPTISPNGKIEFSTPKKSLSITIDKGFDTSEIRAYSPYLFFKSGTGIFLDYFLPNEINYTKMGKEKNEEIEFEIISKEKDNNQTTSGNHLKIRGGDFKSYYFLAPIETQEFKGVNFKTSSEIDIRLTNSVIENTTKIINLLGKALDHNHPGSIEVLIYYDKSRDYLGFEGGALPGQIVLTLSGDDLILNPLRYEREILLIIAHEAVHLWNGYLFPNKGDSPTWLYEGSAEYLSYQLLLSLGMISKDYHDYFYKSDIEKCSSVLETEALGSIDNTPSVFAAYACGHVIFDVLSVKFDKDDKYKLLKELFTHSAGGYSFNSLYKLLKQNDSTASLGVKLDKILSSKIESHENFKSLLSTKSSG